MKHRWAPEGCAIVCGAAWLAALMGGVALFVSNLNWLGRRKCPAETSKQKIIKPGNSGAER